MAGHAIPLAGFQLGGRYFLPMIGNPGNERLTIDLDVPQLVACMGRAMEQPVSQGSLGHTQLIRQFAHRVQHGEQARTFTMTAWGSLMRGLGRYSDIAVTSCRNIC